MTGHVRFEELAAAYALDALDPSEEREATRDLLDHLASCSSCGQLFRELRQTASDLALASPVSAISPAFHDRVMGAVRAERGLATVADQRGRRPAWLRGQGALLRGALAASVTVAVAIGGLSASLSSRLQETQAERRQGEQALAWVTDPSAEVTSLTATQDAGRMTLATRADGRALLIGSDLRLPANRLFEIWSLRGSTPVPLGTFVPVDGHALVELRIDPERDAQVAITVERQRVERPTTEPVFTGSLPA